jgi:hypothetical protein
MINKNITLKAIDPNPSNTVINLGSSRSISIMDPHYYRGYQTYYNIYTNNNGFTTVNDVTIEGITITGTCIGSGITITGTCIGSESVRVWIPGTRVQTGYGQTGYGSYEETGGHWAYFTSSNVTSPIYNFSRKLTLRNCKILAKSNAGHSIFTWEPSRYVSTQLILDNTTHDGDITSGGYMWGNPMAMRYIWLY